MSQTKLKIKQAVKNMGLNPLFESSTAFFKVLGYNSNRQNRLNHGDYAEFASNFVDDNPNITDPDKFKQKARTDQWHTIELLFQLTDTEMGNFSAGQFDDTIINAYLFFALELQDGHYTRTALADITRQLNKVFSIPVLLLLKHNHTITIAIIKRRVHKKDASRDVLEKVTLITGIDTQKPHRAHLEMLFDLSLEELRKKYQVSNFVELQHAWQKTLDSSELNKKFFREIANWYFWAVENIAFPDELEKNQKIRNATAVIRLLTRLIFVWFIKEKALVSEALFQKQKLQQILKDFSHPEDAETCIFYKAILQNLFFATLSTEKDKRKFRTKNWKHGRNIDYKNAFVYRYANLVADFEKWQALFADIPFLNGGLFENLDDADKNLLVDGFSEEKRNSLHVPDFLFFSPSHEIDLNQTFGTRGKKYRVRGVLEILNQYKFTLVENTPIEEEIALDPELLGKVFENLLANFNPETKTTARKQTGSFYTPREIINYMVDESLIAYLQNKLPAQDENWDQLHQLFSYDDLQPFKDEQTQKIIIQALNNCKILDPACGSGAFPMGILQKMVHVLQKLDPDNHDRKLFLVENCIYGVDIQPIAVQISKLRFFIALIVNQRANPNKPNFGIQPLPNLETKFVAANTLVGIDQPKGQMTLVNQNIQDLEKELQKVRHRLFSAQSPLTKKKLRNKDKKLREKMGALLQADGWDNQTAKQLVAWDPYDQNTSSPFFDSKWMFGVADGFDVVIGNPPYGAQISKNILEKLKIALPKLFCKESAILFIEKGRILLSATGTLTYIVPKSLTYSSNYKKTRAFLLNGLNFIVDCGKAFEQVKLETCVFSFIENKNLINYKSISFNNNLFFIKSIIDKKYVDIFDLYLNDTSQQDLSIALKLSHLQKLGNYTSNRRGGNFQKKLNKIKKKAMAAIGGKEIGRYGIKNIKGYVEKYILKEQPNAIVNTEAIICQNIVAHICNPTNHIKIITCITDKNYLILDTINQITINDKEVISKYYLWAILNSKLINWYVYRFIYGKAIRTMHFDNPVTSRIPFVDTKKSALYKTFYCLIVTSKNKLIFESILDAMIFTEYFPDHVKDRKIDILEFVEKDLREVMQGRKFDQLTNDQKEKIINQLHARWTDPENEIVKRMNSFAEKSPDILKPILECC